MLGPEPLPTPTYGLWEPRGLCSCLYQLQLLAILMARDQVVS